MKKVLFATTALVASAGIASAQGVSIGGWTSGFSDGRALCALLASAGCLDFAKKEA